MWCYPCMRVQKAGWPLFTCVISHEWRWRGCTACATCDKVKSMIYMYIYIYVYPHIYVYIYMWGLTACATCDKACVYRKIIHVTLFWNLKFLQNILELWLSPWIPTQIDLHLKIQNTTFLCIEFPPQILSPLHSTGIRRVTKAATSSRLLKIIGLFRKRTL